MKRVSVAGELRMAPARAATPLASHEFTMDGVPVTVVIDRPEVDLAGIAWRCRVRVLRGPGRIEQSQVVGASSRAVLQQALDLVSSRLGISEADLLGDATVGLAAR
ncbi:hypothetical protein [Nocardia sp. NPDC051570]|uniref:hypothetical protein n=1 Tax=Nocardia sp. NPDC051570 TaxID=3364324 RepID=UPI0037B9741F